MKQDILIEKAANGYILTGAKGKRIAKNVEDAAFEMCQDLLKVLNKYNEYPVSVHFEVYAH